MDDPEEIVHEMKYRAATLGLSRLGIPDNDQPGWTCSCKHWDFRATWVPESDTGNNLAAAQRSHAVHVETAKRWTGADLTE